MSDNLPAEQEQTTDFNAEDLKKIQAYKDAGLPGLDKVDDTKIYRMMDLYLSGKTYTQVSSIMGIKKQIVLFVSQRFDWYAVKKEYLFDLEEHMKNRLIDARIVNRDFLLQLTQLWQKKIGNKINKYLQSDNEDIANEIDLKEVDKYLKTVELLERLTSEGKPAKATVGLNVGDGVTIKKKSNNELEITPKQNAIGDMLKGWADFRREEENKSKIEKSSDISRDVTEKQGEEPNENE